MVRPHTFIKLDTEEAEDLKRFMNTVFKERGIRARRRAQAIWFSALVTPLVGYHHGAGVDRGSDCPASSGE